MAGEGKLAPHPKRRSEMIDILKYQGKTCVVTGAASGMGGACAQILVELGLSLIHI